MAYTLTIIDPADGYGYGIPHKHLEDVVHALEHECRDVEFVERVHVATYKCPEGLLLSGYFGDDEEYCAIVLQGPGVLDLEELGSIWLGAV